MDKIKRTFEDKPATRERLPLPLGLVGPTGVGKTFSALRLATGIQRVSGGEIFVIDTESKRARHYADLFNFRHVEFTAPFSPLDYLAAIEHCVAKGAKIVIVDSMSHEHEGPGGVLEMHEREVERLSKGDAAKAERVKMLAWAAPKAARRRLINSVIQLDIAGIICCFRAKEKLKIERGQEPQELGWSAIGAEEFLYEMAATFLLPPGANGVPLWSSQLAGERVMMKKPAQFLELFKEPRQLDEATGEAMALWARGEKPVTKTVSVTPVVSKVIGALGGFGVDVAEVEAYVGHPISEGFTEKEVDALRKVHVELKSGKKWQEITGLRSELA